MCGQRAVAQGANHGETLVIGRLVSLFRRHFAKRELLDDVASIQKLGHRLQRQRELVEVAVAFLNIRVVTLGAVFAEELLHELGWRVGSGTSSHEDCR